MGSYRASTWVGNFWAPARWVPDERKKPSEASRFLVVHVNFILSESREAQIKDDLQTSLVMSEQTKKSLFGSKDRRNSEGFHFFVKELCNCIWNIGLQISILEERDTHFIGKKKVFHLLKTCPVVHFCFLSRP